MLSHRILGLIGAVVAVLYGMAAHAQTRVGPSFDCNAPTVAAQPLAQIICTSDELSRLDLSYAQAFQLQRWGLDDLHRQLQFAEAQAFTKETTEFCSIPITGKLDRPPSEDELSCIKNRFYTQIDDIQDRLPKEARAEVYLTANEMYDLQRGLQQKGFLTSAAPIDGIVGPATRAAIIEWQRSAGVKTTGYASLGMVQALTAAGREHPPSSTTSVTDEATQRPQPSSTDGFSWETVYAIISCANTAGGEHCEIVYGPNGAGPGEGYSPYFGTEQECKEALQKTGWAERYNITGVARIGCAHRFVPKVPTWQMDPTPQVAARLGVLLNTATTEKVGGRYVMRGEIVNMGGVAGSTKGLTVAYWKDRVVLGKRTYPMTLGPIAPGARLSFTQTLDDPPAGTTDFIPSVEY